MLFSSIDLDAPGKQQGYLQVPYSHNLGGWANVMIPMTVLPNSAGPPHESAVGELGRNGRSDC